MIRAAPVWALVVTLVLPAITGATSERFALLVSNNEGGADLSPLRYAVRDSERLRSVLLNFGAFSVANIEQVQNGTSSEVLRALKQLEARLERAAERGAETLLLFYYSGHAKEGHLRMGESKLDMKLLKSILESSRAQIRVAFFDSCGAGEMTRSKGGQLAAPFVLAVDTSLSTRGQIVIASSSADEASQESDEIQGSFFTHYLTTGLRGDADRDRDGRITLDEAYRYTYGRTVAATAATRVGAQHPVYEYDLSGAGDVVLTRPTGQGAVVEFPEELEGRYFLVDLDQQLIVAEIEKAGGRVTEVALTGGNYALKKRRSSDLLMQKIRVSAKGRVVVDESRMQRVAFADDYAKGSPILRQEIDHGRIELSLALAAGGQFVFESPGAVGDELFPPIGFLALEMRLHNLFRRHVLLALDAGFGSREEQLVLEAGGGLGRLEYPLRYSQLQLGSGILYEWNLEPFRIAAGGRLAGLLMVRGFEPGAPVESQFYLTMSPGIVALFGYNLVDWFHVEAMVRGHYLPYNVDANMSFGYVEGLVSVWLDL